MSVITLTQLDSDAVFHLMDDFAAKQGLPRMKYARIIRTIKLFHPPNAFLIGYKNMRVMFKPTGFMKVGHFGWIVYLVYSKYTDIDADQIDSLLTVV